MLASMEETLGQRAKRLRKARGLALKEVGAAVGRSESWVSNLEKGKVAELKAPVATKMAALFAVDREQLEIGQGEPLPLPNAEGDYEYREVRRFVESNPDPNFRARLARQEARRTPESYQRLIFRIFKAWLSNADLGLGEAEEDDLRPGTDR